MSNQDLKESNIELAKELSKFKAEYKVLTQQHKCILKANKELRQQLNDSNVLLDYYRGQCKKMSNEDY